MSIHVWCIYQVEMSGAAKTGLQQLLKVSPTLQKVVGVPAISRPQAVKKVWEVIKAKDLQDSKDRRVIVAGGDADMRELFGKDRVNMLEVGKLLKPHFLGPAE